MNLKYEAIKTSGFTAGLLPGFYAGGQRLRTKWLPSACGRSVLAEPSEETVSSKMHNRNTEDDNTYSPFSEGLYCNLIVLKSLAASCSAS